MVNQTHSLDSHVHSVIDRAVRAAIEAFRRDVSEAVTRAIGGVRQASPTPKSAVAPSPKAPAPAGKRTWPSCSKVGCPYKFFGPSGDARLCYPHYLEAGGRHPGQAKPATKAAAKSGPRPTAKPTPKAAAKPAAAKVQKDTTKAKGNEALVGRILGLINKTPGLRAEQLSKQLGAKPDSVKAVLAYLRESGKVKASGKARGTNYAVA